MNGEVSSSTTTSAMCIYQMLFQPKDTAIANGLERYLCLLLLQANVNMLELSDGCLRSA